MKNFLFTLFILNSLFFPQKTFAGDCTKRDVVDWHATISSAVNVRNNCPSGDVVGVVPSGEIVKILEVDKHGDFYVIETSIGTGFVYNSFLKNIVKSPLVNNNVVENKEEKIVVDSVKKDEIFKESIFQDLDPNHKYYSEIVFVKEKGIVNGTNNGKIYADNPINRAELAKILVEATTEQFTIKNAIFDSALFSDIEAGEWYVVYLHLANMKGIINGDAGKTTVRPADNANGGEVAKMIAIAFDLEIQEPAANEVWYVPYMRALQNKNALPYNDANHKVTRGEMMYMVSQVLKNI